MRYRTETTSEMVLHYVSKARGEPMRQRVSEMAYHTDLENRLIGYFCGDWECWASAMQEHDQSIIDFVRREHDRNRAAGARPAA